MPDDWDGNSPFDFDRIFGSIAKHCHKSYAEIASMTPRQTFGHFLSRDDEEPGSVASEPHEDDRGTHQTATGNAPWLAHPSWKRTPKELAIIRAGGNPDDNPDPYLVPRELRKERFYVFMAHMCKMGQLEGLNVTDSNTGEKRTVNIRKGDMEALRNFTDEAWVINEKTYQRKVQEWEAQSNGVSQPESSR